jgi:hypothetical protein
VKRVRIVSPLSGDVERNTFYAELALLDSVCRGEAPVAFHLLLPRVLDDDNPDDRIKGMAIGDAWSVKAQLAACYMDLGSSPGMSSDLRCAAGAGVPVELRRLQDECAIPDERLIEIYAPARRHSRNAGSRLKMQLLETLFPRLFVDGC